MTRNRKILVAAVAFGALAVAAGGSAFTASNTVPASTLGNGASVVTGATVSSMSYTLTADKLNVSSVHFTVGALQAGAVAEIKITGANSLDTGWKPCVIDGPRTGIDCDTSAFLPTAPVVADVNNTALTVH
jgi:hypothetical protein